MKRFVLAAGVVALTAAISAQNPAWIDPAKFVQPPTDSWPATIRAGASAP
jgi:hypothetical protein